MKKSLAILGTRGIPAGHGGFETFAERLALYLATRGWDISVYCQGVQNGNLDEDVWSGIKRIVVPTRMAGPVGTMEYDWRCIMHFLKGKDKLALTLGYNTAIFNILLRLKGAVNVMNMDGLEWKRKKWNILERLWLILNERIGMHVSNHLIADHPGIAARLSRFVNPEKVSVIPYGADIFPAPLEDALHTYDLLSCEYALVVARPEPENSIYEIVSAFSLRHRGMRLVVLGNFSPNTNAYHAKVISAASDEVCFLGAIYEKTTLQALRYHALAYLHGHQVGGTNPSLVEALAAGPIIIAHDNEFNRWVAGDCAIYFDGCSSCASIFDDLGSLRKSRDIMLATNRERCGTLFSWDKILNSYEEVLLRCIKLNSEFK